jgi:Tol biopolymer transport system component/serine/threonine protein kinase
MMLTPGIRVAKFEIVDTIGAGGMGQVYRARDLELERDVALKVLPEQFAGDAERLARFRREARAIAALNHPNVVTIHSVDEVEGMHFLTMEFVDGKSLDHLIPPQGMPLKDLLQFAVPVARALNAAHERGIIHRDLKPANVMVGRDGRVKVLDFGIAKLQPKYSGSDAAITRTEQLTAAQQVAGTPAYMSPEQAEAEAIDARSDIFSFGIVLYEMATASRPFHGDSAMSIISSILKDTPRSIAELRPDLPPDFHRIVRRCMAKDPARRFQTALDVQNELEDLQQHASTETVVAQARQSKRRIWIATGAALFAAAGFGVYTWFKPFDRSLKTTPLRATFTRLTSRPGAEFFPSLSPDAKWIVYSGEGTGNRDIYLQSVSGQTAINLTQDSADDDEQPRFSPDGELIAFRSGRDGGGIFIMGRTGEAVHRVTRGGFNPAWSSDGKQIAYTTVRTEIRPQNAEERSDLMVVAVTGGKPRTVHAGDSMLPNWSPNNRRIAFSGRFVGGQVLPGISNLFTIPLTGESPRQVTSGDSLDWNPVWAPDGSHLYFISNRGGSPNIWRVGIDQDSGEARGQPEPLTSPASFAAHLSISADGQRIAFSAVQETQNIQKLQFNPSTGDAIAEPVPITTGSRFWSSPDPSPDGKWVVFYSQVQPEGDLYMTRTDGSGVMSQLTGDAATDRVPRWSPDGEWISMFSDRSGKLEVWKMRVDGSELQQVTRTGGGVSAWSPDGRQLAITRGSQVADPWHDIIVDTRAPPNQQEPMWLATAPSPYPQFVPNSWSRDRRWIAGQNGYTVHGISIYSPETRTYQRLIDFGEWPVWLPDSRRILFVSGGREFQVIDTRTKVTKRVFSVVRDTLGPPRLTPDGRAAYFSRRVTESDVWLAVLQ